MISDVLVVVTKATFLFLSALVCLRFSRRSAPAMRHLICLAAVGGSLAIILTMSLPRPMVILHVPSLPGAALAKSSAAGRWPWTEFAAALWASGCVLVMLRFLIGCAALWRLRGSARPFGSNTFTADVSVPMLTGLFRPAILLPRSAVDWPEARRNAAIQHEAAHLDRGDLWANFACTMACAMYWFHPLVWVLARRMRMEQEHACDDAVLEAGFDPAQYAEALVETARQAIGFPLLSCRMVDGTGVKQRVVRVLALRERPAPRGLSRLKAAGTLVLAGVALAGPERIYQMDGSVTEPSVLQSVEPRYTTAAAQARIQGRVLLSMTVSADGLARDIVVEQGVDPGLDQNAVRAVRLWRFKPAGRNGVPVAVKAKVAVNFRLAGLVTSEYLSPQCGGHLDYSRCRYTLAGLRPPASLSDRSW
jgi:TonB family protein